MVLAIGFLLLVSLVVSAVLSSFTGMLSALYRRSDSHRACGDIIVSSGFTTLLFALIKKFVSDIRIQWKDVCRRADFDPVHHRQIPHGLYSGTSGVSSAFGAAGALITVLLRVYYSSLIFFLGAEFTKVYAVGYGSGVVPAENAQPLKTEPQSARA